MKKITKKTFNEWLKLREKTEDEEGELCYCGHTFKCECGDPDFKTFKESVERGAVIPDDENNGWSELSF